ncbi:MAG TPA: dephospho-CoA kinase [Saprospiraceae bacterium]|nr:dephospho-CoA kinase [Saprospiraceae bacterium]
MKLIGLTGGIGSGKSTIAEIFMTLGIPVYESDSRARLLMNSNKDLRDSIIDLLGSDAYIDKELNSSWVASQVFADIDKLEQLNAIVHPAVYTDLVSWAAEVKQQNAPYLIQESAILFEENLIDRFSSVILVVADPEERIARVMMRDKKSREEVLNRVKRQWPDEKKIPLSDFVIFNDSGRSLISQVTDIDQMIRSQTTEF